MNMRPTLPLIAALSLSAADSVQDRIATVTNTPGLDHEKLIFRHNGANRRLTDVNGHVIKEILA